MFDFRLHCTGIVMNTRWVWLVAICLAAFGFSSVAVGALGSGGLGRVPWQSERAMNGPTGVIHTEDGTFDVVRFGTLSRPTVLLFGKEHIRPVNRPGFRGHLVA